MGHTHFSTNKGKYKSNNKKQHRYLHTNDLPHTHWEGNKRTKRYLVGNVVIKGGKN